MADVGYLPHAAQTIEFALLLRYVGGRELQAEQGFELLSTGFGDDLGMPVGVEAPHHHAVEAHRSTNSLAGSAGNCYEVAQLPKLAQRVSEFSFDEVSVGADLFDVHHHQAGLVGPRASHMRLFAQAQRRRRPSWGGLHRQQGIGRLLAQDGAR